MTQWKIGDIARCIETKDLRLNRGGEGTGGRLLQRGRDYTVLGLVDDRPHGELCLDVGAQWGAKLARRFKKVPPNTRTTPAARGVTPPSAPARRDKELVG